MIIGKIKPKNLAMAIPLKLQQEIMQVASKKHTVIQTSKKIVDLSMSLGDEFILRPQILENRFNPKYTKQISLELSSKNEPLYNEVLLESELSSNSKPKDKRNLLYKMVMALTPDGIKEVTGKMNPAEYLPMF